MNYDDSNRGLIQCQGRAKQLIEFAGMPIGPIGLTDIDATCEYHNTLWVFMEVKKKGREIDDSKGQEVWYTRTINAIDRSGKDAVLYVCEHSVEDPRRPILLKDTEVTKAYWKGRWYSPPRPINAKQVFDHAIDFARRMEKWKKENRQ